MSVTICFKHRKRDCECIVPQEQPGFKPASKLLDRKNANEIYYSCKAFKENVVYTPEVVAMIVANYITVADEIWRCLQSKIDPEARADWLVSLRRRLQEAGWHDGTGSDSSGTDTGHS